MIPEELKSTLEVRIQELKERIDESQARMKVIAGGDMDEITKTVRLAELGGYIGVCKEEVEFLEKVVREIGI